MGRRNSNDEWAREPLRHSRSDFPLGGLVLGGAFPFAVAFLAQQFDWVRFEYWLLYPGLLVVWLLPPAYRSNLPAISYVFGNSVVYGLLGMYLGLKWNRRLLKNRTHGTCVKCGYNLTGLTERRCPECGTEF